MLFRNSGYNKKVVVQRLLSGFNNGKALSVNGQDVVDLRPVLATSKRQPKLVYVFY